MKQFIIDSQTVIGANTRFWRAAGCDFLYPSILSPDGQALLDRMQATDSCRYLRNHFSFSRLVRDGMDLGGNVYSETAAGEPVYDFSRMNAVFSELVKRGLKPIVEYDYIPAELSRSPKTGHDLDEGLAMGTTGPSDWTKWRNLLVAFTENLVRTFGREEVRTWYFEVWNEPDFWPVAELPVFFKLYDVFVDAVTSVDPALRVGGPACYQQTLLRDFLRHVTTGVNHVTGKQGTRVDFLSYHIYGLSGGWLEEHPLVQPTVQRFVQELLWVQRLLKRYPTLGPVEFHLNEWGVCSNFYKTVDQYPALAYRNNEFNPAFLVKLVHCLYALADAYQFPVSMLLFWGFCVEGFSDRLFHGKRSLVTAGGIPKPIQTGHEFLALLGDERLQVDGPKPGSNVSLLATRSAHGQVEFVAYHFNELDADMEADPVPVEVKIGGLTGRELNLAVYTLDRDHHNTYRAWEQQGAPRTIQEANVPALMAVADRTPDRVEKVPISNGTATIRLTLPPHSFCVCQAHSTN